MFNRSTSFLVITYRLVIVALTLLRMCTTLFSNIIFIFIYLFIFYRIYSYIINVPNNCEIVELKIILILQIIKLLYLCDN